MLKGLRHGDPPPILFNIVVDMLDILIAQAREDGQVGGPIPHLVEGGVSILQYVEDTLEHDLEKTVNLKLIIYIEHLLGLKTIFHKSEIKEKEYKNIFGCEAVSLPFCGIPTIIGGF